MNTATIRGKKYEVIKITKSGIFTEVPGEIVGGKLLTNGFGGNLKVFGATRINGEKPLLEIDCKKGKQANEEILSQIKKYKCGLSAVLEGFNAQGIVYCASFDIAEDIHQILEIKQKELKPQWITEHHFNLDSAKTNYLLEEFPDKANYLYVQKCTGTVTIKFDSPNGASWTLSQVSKIKFPFKQIYLTWTAQSGEQLIFYVSNKDIDIDVSTSNPTIYNVTMTDADKEYSQALPSNTKKFTLQCRDGTAFRLSFETGKVATPTEPYLTVRTNDVYYEEELNLTSRTIYVASASAAKVVEMICWT